MDAFRSDCVDIDERDVKEISVLLLEIGTVTGDCVNPRRVCCVSVRKVGTSTRVCRFECSKCLGMELLGTCAGLKAE